MKMGIKSKTKSSCLIPKRIAQSIALAMAVAGAGTAHAFVIDTGNPDVKMRFDNQFRYNGGWRMQEVNPAFSNQAGFDETELDAKRGDMVVNRVDIFSELDISYMGRYGARVSGSMWKDFANNDKKTEGNSAFLPNYPNNDFNSYAKRWLAGPSGEWVDAFVYGGWDLGAGTSINVKLGQHNLYWGESLFSLGNSIAYSQGPVDTIKSAVSPGAEVKELFMPTNQISAQLSINHELSVIGSYAFDWRPFRLVPGGTYFAGSDGSRTNYASTAGGLVIPNADDLDPDKKRGDYGIGVRWSPEWLNGTMGFYYRKFDEKIPWGATHLNGSFVPVGIQLAFARDTELYGWSLNKSIGAISTGIEVSYRKNTALNSRINVVSTASALTYDQAEGARGDTWHALINGIYLLPNSPLWTGGSFVAEINYQQLDKIKKNPKRYFGEGSITGGNAGGSNANCVNSQAKIDGVVLRDHRNGCATDYSFGMNISFKPEWAQVLPGLDLAMPVSFAYGLKGNSPGLAGTNEDTYAWSLGLDANYIYRHFFSLKYVQPTHAKYGINAGLASAQNGSAVQNQHGWLSFLYKTTF